MALGPTVTLTFAGDAKPLGSTVKQVHSLTATLDKGFSRAALGVGGLAAAGVAATGVAAGGVLGLVGAFGALGFAALKANDDISKTLEETGKTISKKFGELATPLVKPIQDAAGQITGLLDKIGPDIRSMFEDMGPMIKTLTGGFTGFIEGAMPGFKQAFQDAKPIVDALSEGLKILGPAFGEMFKEMIGGEEGAKRTGENLKQLFDYVALALPYVGKLVNFLIEWGPTLVPIAAGIGLVVGAVKAWTIAQTALNFVMTANPIGIIIVVIGLLVAAVIWAWNNVDGFKEGVIAAWEWIKNAFNTGVAWVKSALAWFEGLPGRAAAWFGGLYASAVGKLNALVAWVRGIPGMILRGLGNLGNLLWNSGRSMIEGLWNGIKSAVDWVKRNISWALDSIRALFPFSPAKEGPFSGKGYTTHSGRALAEDFAKGITSGSAAVYRATESMLDSGPMAALAELREAIRSGAKVHEDISFNGMSANFAKHHPALRDEYYKTVKLGDDYFGSMLRFIDSRIGSTAPAGGTSVTFHGNTSDALARVVQQMIRTGQIQIA